MFCITENTWESVSEMIYFVHCTLIYIMHLIRNCSASVMQ